MARKSTVLAFQEWVKDEANVARVLELIAGGLTLQKAVGVVKQPYTCLHPYFHSTPELEARYVAARKAWADAKQDEAMVIADEVKADKNEVAKAKLRVDVRQAQAKAYYPDRWAERVKVEKDVSVTVDAGLIGTVGELLKISAAKRLPVTIDQDAQGEPGQVVTESPSAALPAPAAK